MQQLVAHWDTRARYWCLEPQDALWSIERWLMPEVVDHDGEDPYLIESSEAYVACATAPCQQCAARIEVITLYCAQGDLEGEPLDHFSVMHISAVDDALEAQLTPWPFFRKTAAVFCNHCAHCGAPQQDIDLHCEPDGVFFHMDAASREAMTLTPLAGRIRLSGEETFEP